jgi:predicted transcriptional regulator of viral defense system
VLDVPALAVVWLGDQDASRVGVRSGARTTNLPQRLRDTLSARVATRGSQRRDGVSGLEIAAARRLGWLLTFVAAEVDLEPLRELAAADEGTPDLRAGGPRRGPLDRGWNVRVNVQVDPDL